MSIQHMRCIIGQIRIYSLLDYILFLFVIGANIQAMIGLVILHIAFLFYLEDTHKHNYRFHITKWVWIVLAITGIVLYNDITVLGYILFSILYAHKDKVQVTMFSSLARGLQYYSIAVGFLGFFHPFALISFLLYFFRNYAGDLRDVEKDTKENMKTLPIILGVRKNMKYIHLLVTFLTSIFWWYYSLLGV